MALIEHALKQCAHLEVVEAQGFGGIEGAFHMNDLLSLLRTFNRMRPLIQVMHPGCCCTQGLMSWRFCHDFVCQGLAVLMLHAVSLLPSII